MTVKVGLVGAGYMAREHLRAFSQIASVVGVVGRTAAGAREFAEDTSIGYSSDSIPRLLDECQPDLLVVAVPELALPSVMSSALAQPIPLLVEKPIGKDLKVAERLTRLVNDAGSPAYVALNRRHYASTRRVIQALEASSSGARVVQVLDQEDQRAARFAGQPEEVVSNWMFANSIHLVDLMRFLCRGAVCSVQVGSRWRPDSPGLVAGLVEFTSGDTAIYEAMWNRPGPWSCAVTTESSRLEMRPLEQLSIQTDGERLATTVELGDDDLRFKPGLLAQAEQAVRMVRGESHTLPDFNDALESMRLVAALYGLDLDES